MAQGYGGDRHFHSSHCQYVFPPNMYESRYSFNRVKSSPNHSSEWLSFILKQDRQLNVFDNSRGPGLRVANCPLLIYCNYRIVCLYSDGSKTLKNMSWLTLDLNNNC